MSGSEIAVVSLPNRMSAGQDARCEPAYTPSDAHPMLMLVPIATNFSGVAPGPPPGPPGPPPGAGCVESEHALSTIAAHRAAFRNLRVIIVLIGSLDSENA